MRFLLYLICFLNINIITKLFVNCGDFALDPKRKGNGLNLNELRSLQKMFNGITVHGKYVDLSDDVKELIDKMSTKYIRANLHYDVGKTLKLLPHEYHLNYVRILASLLFPIIDDEVRLRLVDDVVKQLGNLIT